MVAVGIEENPSENTREAAFPQKGGPGGDAYFAV
jgi:hypothetical protein